MALLSGCAGVQSPPSDLSSPGSEAAPERGPEFLAPPPAPGDVEVRLVHGGIERTAYVHVPAGLPEAGIPLLVMLHPAFTSGSMMKAAYGMDAEADAAGFIVAYPDGTLDSGEFGGRTWNAGHCCGTARSLGVDDVGFVAALIERLQATYPIDPDHIGLAGHSNGAMLAHDVAASRPDLVSSMSAVAGTIGGKANRFAALDQIEPKRPVAAQLMHSEDDFVVPYRGGNPPGAVDPLRIDLSFQQAIDAWRAANRATSQPEMWTQQGSEWQRWQGEADLLAIATQGGHGWPGTVGGQPPFFRTPSEPAATPLVAAFFVDHPR